MADPDWMGGDYYGHGQPERGLAVARMIGHITYMSDQSMEEKFSRRLQTEGFKFTFDAEFEVEGYLRNRGAHFVRRFDAIAISTSRVPWTISICPAINCLSPALPSRVSGDFV
jgi:homoserine acetyltransferase